MAIGDLGHDLLSRLSLSLRPVQVSQVSDIYRSLQCNRIIKLQKKAIRTVMISSYNAHTESFFKNLKLLKIQDILTLQTLKIDHKFRNNKLPYYKIGHYSKILTAHSMELITTEIPYISFNLLAYY